FSSSSYDDEFGAALNNVASIVEVSPVATKRINTIHPQSLIIRDPTLAVQTRSKVKKPTTSESTFISYIYDQQRDNHTDFHHWIKREYSNARTPQQNRVAERKNKTLIEVARTMLADSKLPTMFWTEAVRTVCYVLNRVLVTSPHNKTPYALLTANIPSVSHLKPFGCYVTILNTSDHLGKFDGKDDEGYIIGYSASNKAYRVYNVPNKRVEETINLSPSDLGNHDPSPGIFSSSSYDDEFGA
nr:ribonuclease H-like domain-containing protein [Tanacetum cinerariifolium]